jgi:hypothetical protein
LTCPHAAREGGDIVFKHMVSIWLVLVVVAQQAAVPDRCAAEEAKGRKIPLKALYSTNGQHGVLPLPRRLEAAYGWDLEQIREATSRLGASNVFLVRGKDVAEAIRGTRKVFTGARTADALSAPEAPRGAKECWAVAYFGNRFGWPPAWVVDPTEVAGKTIRIPFRKTKPLTGTGDFHPYFVWVPLGELKEGTYTLELFDTEKKETVLLRRVTVSEK